MNTPRISPVPKTRTPLPTAKSQVLSHLNTNRIKQIQKKRKEVSAIKQELKSNKEFIQHQKEVELKLAREKIQASKSVKTLERPKHKALSFCLPSDSRYPNLKQHFNWISEVEKKIKQMDEQENKLITQISQRCGITLKQSSSKSGFFSSRSNC